MDGDANFGRIQRELARDERPCKRDRISLEVIAEREVAEHLEKRMVACGMAHLLEIVMLAAGTHAFLRSRSAASESWLLQAQKYFLELDHSRVGEQQRRIITRHERGAWPNGVTRASEIIEETKSDLSGLHRREYRASAARSLLLLSPKRSAAIQLPARPRVVPTTSGCAPCGRCRRCHTRDVRERRKVGGAAPRCPIARGISTSC